MKDRYNIRHIDCDCMDLSHIIRFMWDKKGDDAISVDVFLNPYLGFIDRCYIGLCYIFQKNICRILGKFLNLHPDSGTGELDLYWRIESVDQVINILNEFKENHTLDSDYDDLNKWHKEYNKIEIWDFLPDFLEDWWDNLVEYFTDEVDEKTTTKVMKETDKGIDLNEVDCIDQLFEDLNDEQI